MRTLWTVLVATALLSAPALADPPAKPAAIEKAPPARVEREDDLRLRLVNSELVRAQMSLAAAQRDESAAKAEIVRLNDERAAHLTAMQLRYQIDVAHDHYDEKSLVIQRAPRPQKSNPIPPPSPPRSSARK